MGTTPNASPERAETPRSEPERSVDADRAPSLAPAIVSGFCAVAVALITGLFNFLSRPDPQPAAAPPTLTIERRAPTPRSAEVRTASIDTPIAPAAPIYSLNFAAFQAAMKDRTRSDADRMQTLDRVVNNSVLWQGFVDDVLFHDDPQLDWVATVSLVESRELLDQTLFKHPAYCRFASGDEAPLRQLKPGDRVQISGDCVSHSAIATEVRNCRVAGEVAGAKTVVR